MPRRYQPFFSSRLQILNQYAELFNRPYRYVIIGRAVEQSDLLSHRNYLYQENIVVRIDEDVIFNLVGLRNLLYKALDDLIVALELDTNLLGFEFIISHSYYLITRHSSLPQFYFYLGHGNNDSPYVMDDGVYLVRGTAQLNTYISNILHTNHYNQATQYFQDQFPDSSVVVDSVSHIVFHIQPHNPLPSLQRNMYMINDYAFDLDNVI